MNRLLMVFLALICCLPLHAAQTDYAQHIASLIDPAKLATLGKRGANTRVQKAVCWLAVARNVGEKPAEVVERAVGLAGYKNAAAKLTKDALLRNLDIAEKLGCLDDAGLAAMKRGKAPIVRKGPYLGDELSVDHIIPRAVCPRTRQRNCELGIDAAADG
jgi:hypothetical protein